MKKLFISNIVTTVIVLGVITAYSFNKPDGKAVAKYAIIAMEFRGAFTTWTTTIDGKSETLNIKTKSSPLTSTAFESEVDIQSLKLLADVEAMGYQLITSTETEFSNVGRRTYTLRKQ